INAVYFQPQFSEYLNKPKYSLLRFRVFDGSSAGRLHGPFRVCLSQEMERPNLNPEMKSHVIL
ncbi:MAG: hypothetical protein ABL974_15800, partial [Prosthecobacter sp.]